jgi:hypothetical protein
MRAPENESTATAALSYVEGDFRRIGWGPMANAFHDLGTDLFIQVRDDRRFDRGLVVGAQVKGGPSWFEKPERTPDNVLEGWWFYEPNAEHFDDWVTHGLPHLIVLYDFEDRKSYWVHVTADRCVSTGKGCKILVPVNQTVDIAHLDALLDVATAQRAAGAFEQKVFHASAASAPPGRRLRYALLTPRLIAPHGNTGYQRAPEPEEYLALVVRRRSFQISGFQREFPDLLKPNKLKENSDWRWRFALAVGQWLDNDQTSDLRSLLLSAPSPTSRSAAAVVLAASYFESGDFSETQRLLDEFVELDFSSPVDLAWLLVHRATVRSELGEVAGARSDAARATQALRGDEDDPTAALLAGVAANILFVTAGFGSGDLANVINSNDTAPAWWRAQMLSWALGHFDDDVFKEWLNDDRLHFRASDEGWENLEASRLNALLSSDHQAWKSITARQGKHVIRSAHRQRDDLRLLQGLDQLRRAGDGDSLTRALGVVWETGPVSVLREVAELGTVQSFTRSTASATLTSWGAAADALTEEHANELASWCIGILSNDETLSMFCARFGATFRADSIAIKTLKQLLPIASAGIREQAARIVLEVPTHSNLAQDWAWLVLAQDKETFSQIDPKSLRAKALEVEDHLLKDALLRQLICNGDSEARSLLIQRAEHDLSALEFIPDRGKFDKALARSLLEILANRVAQVRKDAARNSFGLGGVDAARLMISFNVLHPDVADWDTVFSFLSDSNVIADHKEDPVALLVAYFHRLDTDIRRRIEQVLPLLLSSQFLSINSTKRHTEAAWQLQIISNHSTMAQERAVATLLVGDASQRRIAARLLGKGVAPSLSSALHPLLADDHRRVRASAAFALGRMLGRAYETNGAWMPAVLQVTADSGALMPSSFLAGISDEPFAGPPGILDAIEALKSHGSFQVRQSTEHLLIELFPRV